MIVDPRLQKQVDHHPYPLVFATISGAHLYGFPSADSDDDLRGVHLLPLLLLNEQAKLPYIGELVGRKMAGGERSKLADADVAFHQREYEGLTAELEQAFQQSQLPESPSAQAGLNDLLVRLRLRGISDIH